MMVSPQPQPSEYAHDIGSKRRRKTSSSQSMSSSLKQAWNNYQYQVASIRSWLDGGCWTDANVNDAVDAVFDDIAHDTTNDMVCGRRRRRSILPLIDLRSIEEFSERHLRPRAQVVVDAADTTIATATVECSNNVVGHNVDFSGDTIIVNLPLATLLSGERSCELPPRNLDFAILIPREYAQIFLDVWHGRERGGDSQDGEKHCIIHKLFFATHSEATMQSRKPWRVRQVLIDTDDLWKDAEIIKGSVVARCDRTSCGGVGEDWSTTPFRSLPRLWKSDPLISSYVLPYLKEWTIKYRTNYANAFDARGNGRRGEEQSKSMGLVWDLGCGSGRDICYLAEEIKEFRARCTDASTGELHFLGVDNHKGSAARCTPLWKNRGVDDITKSICLDLNKLNLVRDYLVNPTKVLHLPSQTTTAFPPDIVCMYSIRYLNRKLLSYIANSRTIDKQSVVLVGPNMLQSATRETHLVLPLGTVVAISHFCKPREGASWKFDHPKEPSVLDRWELKNLFTGESTADRENDQVCGTQRWEILNDDLIVDGDHGRTLIQFVAKKIA